LFPMNAEQKRPRKNSQLESNESVQLPLHESLVMTNFALHTLPTRI
jgi:hypothetical protein